MTHTPGPWFVERMYEASRTIAMMRDFKGPNVALAVHGPQNWIHAAGAAEQIEANARLIAAAPELLIALKETLDYWDSTGFSTCEPDCDCLVESVRDAIHKAEGR